MDKKEIIQLDAKVVSVIRDYTFHAELANGHRIVAFTVGLNKEKAARLSPGEIVKVEMSPYNMSRGRIKFE